MSITLKINGMSCNHCVSSVESVVSVIKGVQDVKVDLKTGLATVEAVNTPEMVATLIATIDDIGFEASEQK